MRTVVGWTGDAQLGERQTEDQEVPGSIPGVGIFSHLQRDCFRITICVQLSREFNTLSGFVLRSSS